MIVAALSVLVLSNAFGRVEISTMGAQVLSYVPSGREDVLFMPADRDFSRNREMHGGIPVCWPWFGRFGEPGSRMHGLARYREWRVESLVNMEKRSRVVLSLASDSETRKDWPYDFGLSYAVELTDRLSLSLVASNACERPFAITQGFHPYFSVKNPSEVTVKGLSEPIRVYPGIDGGHPSGPGGRYRFEAAVGEVMLEATSERKLVVWNPGPDWPGWLPACNLTRHDWRRFVCVEPTVIGRENAVVVKPGESSVFSMSIRVLPVEHNDERGH